MIQQLLLALGLASVTVVVHTFGTVHIVMPAAGIWFPKRDGRKLRGPVMTFTRLVSGLLLLHVAEMTLWATAFVLAGVFPDFETSLYYSLTSYSTVGYGDVVPRLSWRLLGPIEAAVGVLMLGLSTSVIVAAAQRFYAVVSTSADD